MRSEDEIRAQIEKLNSELEEIIGEKNQVQSILKSIPKKEMAPIVKLWKEVYGLTHHICCIIDVNATWGHYDCSWIDHVEIMDTPEFQKYKLKMTDKQQRLEKAMNKLCQKYKIETLSLREELEYTL